MKKSSIHSKHILTDFSPPGIRFDAPPWNFKTIGLYILIGIIALSLGLYFRLYALFSNTTSEASEKATVLVLAQLKATVTKQVSLENPSGNRLEKNRLIKKRFDELLRAEKENVRKTIDRVAKEIDEKSAPASSNKTPYLLESDPYDYYNLTENIVETGTISDTIKGSKYLNKLMMAPHGYYEPLNLNPYVGYFIYRAIKLFNPAIPLMYAVAFTPIVVTVFTIIPFILLCHQLRCHPLINFVGSVFFLLAPIFIKRSSFGWYDNDPYNAFFPLAILYCLFQGIHGPDHFKQKLCWAAAESLLMVAYAFFWQGWVYLFSLIILGGIAIILYNHILLKKFSSTKNLLIYFTAVFLISFAGIAVVFGIEDFFVLFKEGGDALQKFLAPQLSLWPDMYISVGELSKASWKELAEFTGGFLVLTVSLLGLFSRMIESLHKKDAEASGPMIILALFAGSSIYLTLGAQRFAFLCLIPLSLLFPVGLQQIFVLVNQRVAKVVHRLAAQQFILTLLALGLVILPVVRAYQTTPSLLNRIFNETWEKALTKIKNETPPNAIVNSWWPPGHFIKAIAKRRVTFDGATINKPQAYWMANVFLTDNENEALGYLRMLNDSADEAVEYLQSLGFPLSVCVEKLKMIAPLDQEHAQESLTGFLKPDQISHLLNLTHSLPPPSYLLVYNELMEKNLILSFSDRWNFQKVEAINKNPEMIQQIPKRKSKEYVEFLWQIAGGPLRASETLSQLGTRGDVLLFEQGVMVDLKNMTCQINSQKFGKGSPQEIIFLNEHDVVYQKLPDANLSYDLVLLEDNNHYSCMLMDRRLSHSLLTKLYFFDGKGLTHFRPFCHEKDLTGRTRIDVFEIIWEGKS